MSKPISQTLRDIHMALYGELRTDQQDALVRAAGLLDCSAVGLFRENEALKAEVDRIKWQCETYKRQMDILADERCRGALPDGCCCRQEAKEVAENG